MKQIIVFLIFSGSIGFSIAFKTPSPDDELRRNCPRYYAMITSTPDSKIANRLDNDKAIKRTYRLDAILSIVTGRNLVRSEKVGDVASVIGFVVGENYDPIRAEGDLNVFAGEPYTMMNENLDKARLSLLKQYPELEHVVIPKFKDRSEALKLVDELEEKYGKLLTVIQAP